MLTQGDFLPFLTKPISGTFLLIALLSVIYSAIKEGKQAEN
jgi:TctA family transporter